MMPELTQEQLDDLKSRDERLQAVDLGLIIRHASQPHEAVGILIKCLDARASVDIRRLATASPLDSNLISDLQTSVRSYYYLLDTLAVITSNADLAETSLREQDMTIEREYDPD